MTFRMYILFMSIATVLLWGAWGLVILNTNPHEAGAFGFLMFYVTLFMALIGALTLTGVVFRTLVLHRHQVLMRQVRVSFRHAVLLSALSVSVLAVSGYGNLRWWMVALLILFVSIIEYLFLLGEEARRT